MSADRTLVAGRYEIERRLGGGGMGQVFLARQIHVGNRVAIKFLSPQLCHDEQFVARFLQEARVSLEVTHPGAAQVLDTGREPDGQLFIVFEHVDGEDLRQRLERDGALDFIEARDIVLRIAEVLAFAHSRNIVHRDIKPENVRIRRDLAGTHVKVLDFGIARLTQSTGARLTTDGGVAGTPQYMAPEQIRAEEVDARTDLYSLGLVLFEMVAGRAAFTASSIHALMYSQVNDPLPKLGDVQPSRAFPELDAVLHKACAKNRDERYGGVQALISALIALPNPHWAKDTVLVPQPVVPRAQLATPVSAVQLPRPSNAKWWLMGGLALALLATSSVVVFAVLLRPTSAQTVTPVTNGPPWGCVELAYYDRSLTDLDIPELERRVIDSRMGPPSAMKTQIPSLKASSENIAPEKRECFYRSALIGTVASQKTMFKTVPETWGQTKEVPELKMLFLEMPLKQKWTVEERKRILATIENTFIANLQKNDPGDGDYWRRMYLGIELTCEATDETLERLGAQRAKSCLNLSP